MRPKEFTGDRGGFKFDKMKYFPFLCGKIWKSFCIHEPVNVRIKTHRLEIEEEDGKLWDHITCHENKSTL